MPLWLLLSLSAACIWAVGQTYAKKGFVHISPLWNNIFANIFTLFLWVPAALLLSNFHIVFPSFPVMMAIFTTGTTYMVYFYALSRGEVALTGSLWSMYPISTVILSYIFLHERITPLQLTGILTALFGALLIALPEKKLPKALVANTSWIWWGTIGAMLSGCGDFFAKVAVNSIGSYSQIFFLALIFQILSVANYFVDPKGRELPAFSWQKFLPTFIATFLAIAGALVFLIALNFGKASLVVPTSSVYPALLVVLAVIFLKEKVSKKQLVGIAAIVCGIILIGIR